jgi:hypothetical protein
MQTNRSLQPLGTVVVSKTKKFIVRKNFKVNTSAKAPVKISYVGGYFKKWFLDKIEKPANKASLCYYDLLKLSTDEAIIAELGGEIKVETSLAVVYALMEKQNNGGSGVLLNNNIFYVRDIDSVIRAVYVDRRDTGWSVCAGSVEVLCHWLVGSRAFSPNS